MGRNVRSNVERISLYMFTSFQDRLQSVIDFLTTKPDNSDTFIARQLGVSDEFVRRQRKFMGIPEYVKEKPRVVEPITDPDDLERERELKQTRNRRAGRGRGYSRHDVYEQSDNIKLAYEKGAKVKQIAAHLKCSEPLIRKILEI